MKRITLAVLVILIAVGLAIYAYAAQGNGAGCGMKGAGKQGQMCPMGKSMDGQQGQACPMKKSADGKQSQTCHMGDKCQVCPMTQGQPCPMAKMDGANKGWWKNAKPETPAQKTFIKKVTALHEQMMDKQAALASMKKNNASKADITKATNEIKNLRAQIHQFMMDNKELRQQMAPKGAGKGMMKHQGGCPMMGKQNK